MLDVGGWHRVIPSTNMLDKCLKALTERGDVVTTNVPDKQQTAFADAAAIAHNESSTSR